MAEEDPQEGSAWREELQVLQSIYLEELAISREDRVKLRITLHPATADDAASQYVRLTLHLSLPPQYPDEPPEIRVSNPRGLCDDQIHSISEMLRQTAAQSVGGPLLYELIENGKEMLTASNVPRGHCVICLYDFQEADSFTKTPCFHHFHSHCLGRYAEHFLQENPEPESALVLCPVCRERLTCDFNKLQEAPPPQNPEEHYIPDTCTLQRDLDLRQIYERQLANGGIIDVEAERNRFFISIQEQAPPSDPSAPAPDPAVPDETQESSQEPKHTSCEEHAQIPPTSKEPAAGSCPPEGLKFPPVQREHREGQHWRGGRGWNGRPRFDNRRIWRGEEGHRDFHPQNRGRGHNKGRGTTRGYHGTGRAPPRGGVIDNDNGRSPLRGGTNDNGRAPPQGGGIENGLAPLRGGGSDSNRAPLRKESIDSDRAPLPGGGIDKGRTPLQGGANDSDRALLPKEGIDKARAPLRGGGSDSNRAPLRKEGIDSDWVPRRGRRFDNGRAPRRGGGFDKGQAPLRGGGFDKGRAPLRGGVSDSAQEDIHPF